MREKFRGEVKIQEGCCNTCHLNAFVFSHLCLTKCCFQEIRSNLFFVWLIRWCKRFHFASLQEYFVLITVIDLCRGAQCECWLGAKFSWISLDLWKYFQNIFLVDCSLLSGNPGSTTSSTSSNFRFWYFAVVIVKSTSLSPPAPPNIYVQSIVTE